MAGASGTATGGSAGTVGSGGSGGGLGGGGSAGSAGSGGSGAGASGGSGGAGASGGGGGGPGALKCTSGTEKFKFVVSENQHTKRVALPLNPGVEYRKITLQFSYTPTQWSGHCFNPATSKGSGFPKFESWVSLKRGPHWCKGGNAFSISMQGPASGHGASNKANAQTHYKAKQHTGNGCGATTLEDKIFNAAHGVSAGKTYSATIVYDQTAGTLSANTGGKTLSGQLNSGVKVIANGSESWNVVLSFDGGYLECFNSQGQHDNSQPCCYGPSIGWVYEDLNWEVCS